MSPAATNNLENPEHPTTYYGNDSDKDNDPGTKNYIYNKDKDDENDDENDDDDDDALFKSLENEDDSTYRTQRIEQLNAEFARKGYHQSQTSHDPLYANSNSNSNNFNSTYPTLPDDKILLEFTTETHRCVIHFAHPDFARCRVMDEHLRELAVRHDDVRCARVDVRDVPFVVEKLNIRVLPCVIGFKDGMAVERVVGFEGLGVGGGGGKQRQQLDGVDQFSTLMLEKRLLWKGVLVKSKFSRREESGGDVASDEDSEGDDDDEEAEVRQKSGRRAIRGPNPRNKYAYDDDGDDDDDWN